MTAQVSETLILDGKPQPMTFCPPLPDPSKLAHVRHETVEEETGTSGYKNFRMMAHWTDADGKDHVEEDPSIIFSTACWRQYIGTWEVRDGRFYLVGLKGRFRLAREEPLLADWFTGMLRVPQGEQLAYVHMGFGSVYETELHIAVERGEVKARRIYDNRNKEHDEYGLGLKNLPGGENRFPGDRD